MCTTRRRPRRARWPWAWMPRPSCAASPPPRPRSAAGGGEPLFLLAKNPAGFNEVLRTVLLAEQAPVVLIAINDLIADGRDISWLWDVDFEMLRARARAIVVTGMRALDLALRLKY